MPTDTIRKRSYESDHSSQVTEVRPNEMNANEQTRHRNLRKKKYRQNYTILKARMMTILSFSVTTDRVRVDQLKTENAEKESLQQ